jgi:transposase
VAKKIRRHRDEIRNTLLYRLTNGPVEGMNSRIRMIINTGRGFRDTGALIALIRLCLCGYDTPLPYQQLRRALAA